MRLGAASQEIDDSEEPADRCKPRFLCETRRERDILFDVRQGSSRLLKPIDPGDLPVGCDERTHRYRIFPIRRDMQQVSAAPVGPIMPKSLIAHIMV